MKAILVIMKVYSSIVSSISNTKVNQCTNDIMLYNSSMSDKLSLSIIYRTSHGVSCGYYFGSHRAYFQYQRNILRLKFKNTTTP